MNPRDFQPVAEELLRASDAPHNRAAIGRAYYAAFNVAAELLRDANFNIPKSAAGHLEVTRLIKASENEVVMRAGSRIEDMRGTRNRADYDMTRKEVERDATAASVVADARRCVENLDASFSGSNRAAIVAAMQGWQKRISPGGS